MEEVVVEEMRKARLDLLARAKFARDGEQLTESRLVLDDEYQEYRQTDQFRDLIGDGMVEVG
jgi:hypothetical protein